MTEGAKDWVLMRMLRRETKVRARFYEMQTKVKPRPQVSGCVSGGEGVKKQQLERGSRVKGEGRGHQSKRESRRPACKGRFMRARSPVDEPPDLLHLALQGPGAPVELEAPAAL